VKLFSQNSDLYDHDTSTSLTDGRTDGQLVLAIPRSATLRAVNTGRGLWSPTAETVNGKEKELGLSLVSVWWKVELTGKYAC